MKPNIRFIPRDVNLVVQYVIPLYELALILSKNEKHNKRRKQQRRRKGKRRMSRRRKRIRRLRRKGNY